MKTITLFLVLFGMSVLTGCGGSNTEQKNTPPIVVTPETPTPSPSPSPIVNYPDYNTNPLSPDLTGMEKSAKQISAEMALGWNAGNTLEATGGETAWGNPKITAELIKLVKASGFDAIRLPIAWNQYADQTTAKIDTDWLNRIKQVIQLCLDEDLYVLINIHWDGGWLENNVTTTQKDQVNAKQKAFWQQIATHLRDFDQRLLFASANEPAVETSTQMDVLMAYHQTFVDAVRSTGGKNTYRTLVVQGPVTDIEKTYALWKEMPIDNIQNRLMAEVHLYTPYNYTIMWDPETWGNPFYYWGEKNHSSTDLAHNPTWGEEAKLIELLDLVKKQFIDKDIPVLMGEFSATRRSHLIDDKVLSDENQALHLNSRSYYHQFVVEQALKRQIIPFYWDNGPTHTRASGIFDRHNNSVYDELVLKALIEGRKQAQQTP